ncbi:MAG: biotin-independent malonate decarboxylase subunit gamma [Deltaproteobacteria bacterium]|nr:biotin-independent malonate decarboxylase subunit gamma [Deltaproteobacteria bacterium]
MEDLIGQGRAAIDMIVDPDSFVEGEVGELTITDEDFGASAVIGTAELDGEICTIIANDAMTANPKFPVVYAGIIGLEEGYKMALAVYHSIKADKQKPLAEKRPLVLIVDTPGNGAGKQEEIFGMNKSTGAYQMALAEARKAGHPIVAMVVGRAISGGFLCHGLQADHVLALSQKFNTMIHVMPITSIARITKLDIEWLQELAENNPVFAAGPDYFYKLGGVEELIDSIEAMRERIIAHVAEVRAKKIAGKDDELGPWGRGTLSLERGSRLARSKVMQIMNDEFAEVAERYLS